MSATLQVRVDEDLKRDADSLFSDIGMDMNGAIRLFLRQSVIRRRFPFEIISSDPFYSAENQRILSASIAELEAGNGTEHELMDED